MVRLLSITNSTKAKLIVAVNALLALAIGFGLPLSDAQTGLVMAAVNALLALFVHSPNSALARRLRTETRDS